MVDALSIALSGLTVQGKRLNASANNVANALTSGRVPTDENPQSDVYKPLEVNVYSATIDGQGAGAFAKIVEKEDGYSKVYAPEISYADDEGMIAMPNVSLEEEAVNMLTAKIAYKANLATIKTQDEMMGELLDSIS